MYLSEDMKEINQKVEEKVIKFIESIWNMSYETRKGIVERPEGYFNLEKKDRLTEAMNAALKLERENMKIELGVKKEKENAQILEEERIYKQNVAKAEKHIEAMVASSSGQEGKKKGGKRYTKNITSKIVRNMSRKQSGGTKQTKKNVNRKMHKKTLKKILSKLLEEL